MAQTVLTSATAYAAPGDLVNYCDVRQIGDWCSDDDTRVSASNVLTNTIVLAALSTASGRVEASCLKGGRYTPADLQALTGVGQMFLKELVCVLAMYYLARRRRFRFSETRLPDIAEAEKALKSLELGQTIFSFEDSASAGLAATTQMQEPGSKIEHRYTRWLGVRCPE